jgi:hypothetical protein
MPKIAGRTAKARWNSQVVSFQSYRVIDADTGVDITNSEGGGASDDIASCDNVRITLDFPTIDTDEALFVAPRLMKTNQTGTFLLACNGIGGGWDWQLPSARVASVEQSGRVGVGGGQPVSVSIVNKGPFKRPGEA